MHEAPNGQNELSAKWAGSAKILGCYKRIFLIFLLDLVALDNNIENIRTANVNLKVTDRDNNCHISKVSYKMWDHWNFEFSPHKLTKDQKCIALELQEYHWQVRENSVFIKRTVSDLGEVEIK
jgi:NhaP-type Na+/H+ and K+/H+ antiporter